MERQAVVEVFVRDAEKCMLVVEPRSAVDAVRKHIEAQRIETFESIAAGDFGVYANGNIHEVLHGAAKVIAVHQPETPSEIVVQGL